GWAKSQKYLNVCRCTSVSSSSSGMVGNFGSEAAVVYNVRSSPSNPSPVAPTSASETRKVNFVKSFSGVPLVKLSERPSAASSCCKLTAPAAPVKVTACCAAAASNGPEKRMVMLKLSGISANTVDWSTSAPCTSIAVTCKSSISVLNRML